MSKRPCPSHVGSSTSPSGRRAACRDFGRMLSAPSRRYLPGRRRGPEADPPRVPRRATAAVGALPPAASASAAAAGWPLAMRRVPCRGWRRRPPSWPTPVHRARRRGRRAPATRTPRAAASWEIWVRRAGTAARRGPHAALLPRAPSGAKKLAWGGGLANPDAAVAHGVERGARRLGVCHGSEASRCHADQWSGAATTAARRRAAAASARPRRRAFSMFFPCLLARARSVSGPSERAHTLGCVAGATARARGGPGTRFVCLVLCLLGARTLARHSLHGVHHAKRGGGDHLVIAQDGLEGCEMDSKHGTVRRCSPWGGRVGGAWRPCMFVFFVSRAGSATLWRWSTSTHRGALAVLLRRRTHLRSRRQAGSPGALLREQAPTDARSRCPHCRAESHRHDRGRLTGG